MDTKVQRCYEFGAFRVDGVERRLMRGNECVPLPPKIFDTLLVLVANSGHLMSRDELMRSVWKDTFVEENNLTQYISTLRRVLGDSDETLIETVPRRGYRFAGVVSDSNGSELFIERRTRGSLRIEEETVEQRSPAERLFSGPLQIAAIFLLVATVVAGALVWSGVAAGDLSARGGPMPDEDALDMYQRGRALWQTREAKDLHQATMLLEQAVDRDPDFALARAALADAYAFDYRLWQQAEGTAREAIRLDPALGQPHATIGFVKMFWEWKIAEAEAELKEAVRLSPDNATARQWYAINLHANGRSGAAALAEMTRALELEPDSPAINADLCQTLYFLRRYDEALAQCHKVLKMDAGFINAHSYLYEVYSARKMYAEAVDTFFLIERLSNRRLPPDEMEVIREAWHTGGIRGFWRARIDSLPGTLPLHYRTAQHYARLGERDQALDHLQKAYETRDFDFILFLADPVFEELHLDPRYENLKNSFLSTAN